MSLIFVLCYSPANVEEVAISIFVRFATDSCDNFMFWCASKFIFLPGYDISSTLSPLPPASVCVRHVGVNARFTFFLSLSWAAIICWEYAKP